MSMKKGKETGRKRRSAEKEEEVEREGEEEEGEREGEAIFAAQNVKSVVAGAR